MLISETKLNHTFPLSQFVLEEFRPPCRLHRTVHGGGLMLSIREDIPSKLLPNINPSGNIENIFVKINLSGKNGLFQAPITLVSVFFKITQSI